MVARGHLSGGICPNVVANDGGPPIQLDTAAAIAADDVAIDGSRPANGSPGGDVDEQTSARIAGNRSIKCKADIVANDGDVVPGGWMQLTALETCDRQACAISVHDAQGSKSRLGSTVKSKACKAVV